METKQEPSAVWSQAANSDSSNGTQVLLYYILFVHDHVMSEKQLKRVQYILDHRQF